MRAGHSSSKTSRRLARARALLCVLALLGPSACSARDTSSKTATAVKKVLVTPDTYPVELGSPGRDSSIPSVTSAKGVVAWSAPLRTTASPGSPPAVLVWSHHPVVVTWDAVSLFAPAGGPLWEKRKQGGSPVAVGPKGLAYKDADLNVVDLSGGFVVRDAPFHGASDPDVAVELLWPREQDFVTAVFSPGQEELPEGADPKAKLLPPSVTAIRSRYGRNYSDWEAHVATRGPPSLRPLFLPARNVLTLAADVAVRLQVAEKKELSRFPLVPAQVVDWSVDADEVYCLAGYEGGKKVLVALDPTGKELWRWTDVATADAWAARQPPIRAGGRVYALTEGRVLALERGKAVWVFELDAEARRATAGTAASGAAQAAASAVPRRGSVLADGSLLVTSGRVLVHLGGDGSRRFSLALDRDILSAPVVDSGGAIYVATATHLVRVQ